MPRLDRIARRAVYQVRPKAKARPPELASRLPELEENEHGAERLGELGWMCQELAPIARVIDLHLPSADAIHAPHPRVASAAIWYLGPGVGAAANRAQPLIAPLTA